MQQVLAARLKVMASTSTENTPVSVPFLARWSTLFLVVGVLCALGASVLLGAFGNEQWWGTACASIAVVSLILWVLGAWQWRRMRGLAPRDAHARQRSLRGANALLSTLLLAVFLTGLNWLNARHARVWDWTQNNRNSLSDQTQRILNDLKFDVTITYVYQGNAQRPEVNDALDLLRIYQSRSPRVKLQVLDAAVEPQRARVLLNNVRSLPMAILQRDDSNQNALTDEQKAQRRCEVTVLDEANLSSALLRLANPQTRTLQMLSGHGETPLWSGRAGGAFDALARDLGAQNYNVHLLSLAAPKAQVPKDSAAVLIIAPQSDLGESELQTLLKYWQNGGRFVFWLAPSKQTFARWNRLLNAMDLQWQSGVVLDGAQSVGSAEIVRGALDDPRLGGLDRQPILRGVKGDVLLPGASVLGKTSTPVARAVKILFASGARSYAREIVDPASPRNAEMPTRVGPFLLSGAIENANRSRAWIVASADFASDRWAGEFGNRSFALAGINWVAGDKVLVSIPSRAPVVNNLSMPDDMKRLSLWFSLFALPLGCLLLGALVWWKRR